MIKLEVNYLIMKYLNIKLAVSDRLYCKKNNFFREVCPVVMGLSLIISYLSQFVVTARMWFCVTQFRNDKSMLY